MKRWCFGILLLHLGFFGSWAAVETWRRHDPVEFLLETEGADPRDVFAGQYLALAYPAARLDRRQRLQDQDDGAPLAVHLEAQGNTRVGGRLWPLRRSVGIEPILDGDASAFPAAQGWARGEARGGRVQWGIERYYFSEDREDELRKLVPGRYFALVALSPDGRLRIRQLVW